jgi:AcrR family transcriptional regulator
VAERGYAATTVADIVDRASVSRSTFYEQFPDKESCFIAAFDYGVEYMLGRMQQAAEALGTGDWRDHVRSDLSTYLKVLAGDTSFARALHVEVLAAGPVALARRAQILAMFSDRTRGLHERARGQDPTLPDLPDAAFALHSGGIDEIIRQHVLAGGIDQLTDLEEPLITATLRLFGERS